MRALVVLGALGGSLPAIAGPTGRVVGKVLVTEADGKPSAGGEVIVYVVGSIQPPGSPSTPGPQVKIEQKGRTFVPDLVAVTVGDTVTFPNSDPFLHNVFSQSGTRRFDLGSFKKGDHKEKEFPTPGVVDVYCNIHPEMAATILVLPNRHHTHTTPDGRFTLEGIPPGDWTLFAYTRRAAKPVSARVSVKAGADTTVDVSLQRGAEPPHLNKYGEKYRPEGPATYR
jgi:plastocyanin